MNSAFLSKMVLLKLVFWIIPLQMLKKNCTDNLFSTMTTNKNENLISVKQNKSFPWKKTPISYISVYHINVFSPPLAVYLISGIDAQWLKIIFKHTGGLHIYISGSMKELCFKGVFRGSSEWVYSGFNGVGWESAKTGKYHSCCVLCTPVAALRGIPSLLSLWGKERGPNERKRRRERTYDMGERVGMREKGEKWKC